MNLRANCIGLWRMNDNAANKTVVDSSGNGIDGEAQQNTEDLHTDGKIKGALTFNGSSDYIAVDFSEFPNNKFSLSIWLYITDLSAIRYAMYAQEIGYASEVIRLYVTTAGFLYFLNDFGVVLSEQGAISINTWYHIVVTIDYDTQKAEMFLDNQSVATDTSFNQVPSNGSNLFYIGRTTWMGKLDAVMVFDKILSVDEVAFLWNGGEGREHLGIARPLVGGSLASGRKGLV